MPFMLVGIDSDYRFELCEGPAIVVGRAANSGCPVVDGTVSRRHAELVVAGNGVQVTDLGSSNGTFVNGVKVDGYFVVPGDTLAFGRMGFRVEDLVPAAGGPPAVDRHPTTTLVRPVTQQLAAIGKNSGSIKAVMAGDAGPAEKDRQKLQLLLDVSTGLSRTRDIEALLGKMADYAFDTLEADRCAILLLDPSGALTTKISRDRRGGDVPQVVPQTIARRAVDEKVAVLSDDAGDDQRFTGQSVVLQRVRSALCVPLIGSENKVLGVLYLDNTTSRSRFGEADLEFLIAFAGIAAVALENSQFADRIRRQALVRSNFERFFTPHLAARIANGAEGVQLGGDKRPIAVLFSDIRGFTTLSESMNPDAMAKLLTEYFTEMVECVFRHGGTLDKFIGDSVMAQWGAPLGATDDVDRAMDAALDMMDALETLNARWSVEGRPTLRIGIGLNFGEAFAGNIGSERRLEYTVIGDTVNTANRLCAAAEPGEILLTETFRAALHAAPPLTEMPPLELRGKNQGVPVFRVSR